MKSTSNLKLAIGLSVFAAMPATAETLITIPTLSDAVLTAITSNSTTSGGLFEQTGNSVGSTSTATLIPGVTTGAVGGSLKEAFPDYFSATPTTTHSIWGADDGNAGKEVYNSEGLKLYDNPFGGGGDMMYRGSSLTICITCVEDSPERYEYVYDASGAKLTAVNPTDSSIQYWVRYKDDRYSTPLLTEAEVAWGDVGGSIGTGSSAVSELATISGVQSLANMSALVLNNLTLSTDAALAAADGTYATQTAFAYGSTSTANLTLPNVSDVATIANTALGTLNSISVTVAAAPISVVVE